MSPTPNLPAVAQDTWGALSIPAQPGYGSFTAIAQSMWKDPAFVPYADPCLCVVLDYLATAINTDAIIQPAWGQLRSTANDTPIRRVFAHNPGEVDFSVSYLPALFLWRESFKTAYAADEWYRVTTNVKGLWVFPLSTQKTQRPRDAILNALVDGIVSTIERGRTPSWIQPADTDPRSSYEGSVFYPYAGFESFFLSDGKRSKLLVPAGKETLAYPAIELNFTMEENQIRGITRFFVQSQAPLATLYDASSSAAWAANTGYLLNALVFPTGGNGFVYICTTAGTTANTPPAWPTVVGQSVGDGQVVWKCSAAMSPNGNQTVSGPL